MKLFLNEIVNRIKANKIIICIFILCIIFVGLLLNKIIKEEYNGEHEYSYNTLTQGSGRTPIIRKDEKISQKFFANNNNLFKIGIFALTPTGNSESNVNVIIKECKTNKEILNQNVFLGLLNDGKYFEIFIENQPNSKNREYEIIITGIDGTDFNSIQFPYSSDINSKLNGCYISNELQENNLILKITYTNYISTKLQLVVLCVLLVCGLIFILLFLNDKELILENLNFNIKDMLLNLKNNWYWIISIFFAYMLYTRQTKLEYEFLIISFILDIFILTQIKSLTQKLKQANIKIKIFSFISTFGICWYANKLFLETAPNSLLIDALKKVCEINKNTLKILSIFITIMASFIIFTLITIFINYIFEKIKNLFENFTKKEKIFYCILLLIIFGGISYAFSNSTAFYGTENSLFDVLFTSDSGRLVTQENVYLSIYHGENDLRQPLFAVFAMPFVGFGYAISLLTPFIKCATPLFMNLVQVTLFFIANLMISKLLNLKPMQRCIFMILSFCTYMAVLFSLMMEQYLIAYFWLIIFIYLICNKKQDELVLTATGGTLLTSLALIPYIFNNFSIKKIKEFFISLVKAGVLFITILIVFNRIDLIENIFLKQEQYGTFVDNKIDFVYKLKGYTKFVENCFIYPETYVSTESRLCPYSFQCVNNEKISYIGIGIIIFAVLGFFFNRKDKFSQISFIWILFSYIIVGIIGWGTAENGTILYSLYFGWPFLVLVYKLLQYICNKIKVKRLLEIITIVLIILLLYINFEGIKILINFALNYYKI